MSSTQHDRADRTILLVGHPLTAGPGSSATAAPLNTWARRHRVTVRKLPVPAFALRAQEPDGRPAHVAERLAELDELETVFGQLAEQLARGDRVLGLVVSAEYLSSRSGRAWIDRVRATAHGIAGLDLAVWTQPNSGAVRLEPALESIRSA